MAILESAKLFFVAVEYKQLLSPGYQGHLLCPWSWVWP